VLLENNVLGVYRLSETVEMPTFATEGSAAFDLRVFLDGTAVKGYDEFNDVFLVETAPYNILKLLPGCRYMIPTGLILDIPKGFRVDINIRGGTGLKKGLCLSNDTGLVDEDYVQEVFVLVLNTSNTVVTLENGERIAQAKLEKVEPLTLLELQVPPYQKTSRSGGFNSTGTK
jgi:dUTP pyrophosphatase